MKEYEDYIITEDPVEVGETEWVVILQNGEWDKFVVKFRDIQVINEGHTIDFILDVMYIPEDAVLEEEGYTKFEKHCGLVLAQIMIDFHEQKANVYTSKESGERIEY